jgi:hypothetical protein
MEVHPSVPANTVAEFIALAKQRPGKINMASAGVGTGTHLAGELFQIAAGVSLFHVPYRGVQALRDVVAGQADVYFGVVASSLPQIRAGKLRALAVTTANRSAVLPDVPAMAEVLPGYEFSAWYALGAPKGTPASAIERLNREVNAALADPQFSTQLAELGGIPIAGSPADLGRLFVSDTDRSRRSSRSRTSRSNSRTRRDHIRLRPDVDGEGEDRGVEGKGDDAVHQADQTHLARDGGDVAGLGRAPDHEGIVEEVAIVGLALAGEFQPARRTVRMRPVVDVGIVQREDHVGEGPRQHHRDAGDGEAEQRRPRA